MIVESYRKVIVRDLRALAEELKAYEDEATIWLAPPGVPNSPGTLALHLAGNLRSFIGAELGETGYVRDREREFAARDLSREEILGEIEEAIGAVEKGLTAISDDDLERDFPVSFKGETLSTGLFLTHLVAHFAYHLGQIDYHRRLVTGQTDGVGAVSIPGLLD
jgi:hypothetical protein